MARPANRSPTLAERERIQEIVDLHRNESPDGVQQVRFNFGEDKDGDPAVYLELIVRQDVQPTNEKIEELNRYTKVLLNAIIASDIEYWPYARTLVEEP